jgi:hypothetical protein
MKVYVLRGLEPSYGTCYKCVMALWVDDATIGVMLDLHNYIEC